MIKYIYFRCFAHATEDIGKVRKAFKFITQKDNFKEREEKGYYRNKIIILETKLTKKNEVVEFWRRMKDYGIVDEILPMLDEIVDEQGMLYLRFDKQQAYLEKLALTIHGDSIAMHAKLESYPMKKGKAISNFKKFVEEI